MAENRPEIKDIASAEELKRWYWLKAELVAFARAKGIPASGQKRVLTERIGKWLETGEIVVPAARPVTSRFDWGKADLTLETPITDSYRNTQKVRAFMKTHAGQHFAFSNEFMQWMRDNVGKTLQEAVAFWVELDDRKRNDGYREKPLPQNQFNQFTRALSEVKPGISSQEIRRLWALKRAKPGPHVYEPGDEEL